MLLWNLNPVNAYSVVPILKSAEHLARGLSAQSGIKYEEAIGIKTEYLEDRHRVFQKATEVERIEALKEKYEFRGSYEGLRMILADDSVVRDTTLKYMITQLRMRGVAQIHARIGTPPIVTSCHLGIHTPTRKELIAGELNADGVENYFRSIFYGVDFEREELISMVKRGDSVEEIVRQSAEQQKNFLRPEMRIVRPGEFTLGYLPMELFKHVFDDAGLNSSTKCYACQVPNGMGYLPQERKKLIELNLVA